MKFTHFIDAENDQDEKESNFRSRTYAKYIESRRGEIQTSVRLQLGPSTCEVVVLVSRPLVGELTTYPLSLAIVCEDPAARAQKPYNLASQLVQLDHNGTHMSVAPKGYLHPCALDTKFLPPLATLHTDSATSSGPLPSTGPFTSSTLELLSDDNIFHDPAPVSHMNAPSNTTENKFKRLRTVQGECPWNCDNKACCCRGS